MNKFDKIINETLNEDSNAVAALMDMVIGDYLSAQKDELENFETLVKGAKEIGKKFNIDVNELDIDGILK